MSLLERALGELSGKAREVVELCYLVELPQREAALRLGLTISALEARLHRARRQICQPDGHRPPPYAKYPRHLLINAALLRPGSLRPACPSASW